MKTYLGVDVGSVTTKMALLDDQDQLIACTYLRTQGKPISIIQQGLEDIRKQMPPQAEICGVATTGSARYLAGVVLGADSIKNEITSHAVAAMHYVPEVQTVVEIGGQDSKIILIRDGVVVDFGMNTVCAAGTGSFLEHQASRLNMDIEEFGSQALKSKAPVRIAGRCTVFAESDMVHKQQIGHRTEDIVYGLCQALVRNYLNNVALGKEILPPVVFQGGVAFNQGIIKALEEALEVKVIVPPHHELMGAIGAALLLREEIRTDSHKTNFKGFEVSQTDFTVSSFVCKACPNLCEIAQISVDGKVLARWGGRCDLWEGAATG
ncbi:MAG: 2-hydroxyglutaryl-CoA dehydratase [Chloroflexi bacterium]|nr:2-hydroxyglutaryl-CoA dehydratase [Chloroflexota bacterium]